MALNSSTLSAQISAGGGLSAQIGATGGLNGQMASGAYGFVRTTPQDLTEEQKAQARKNIGVENTGGGSGGSGEDGFSPIANVAQTSTGAVITITDKVGTTTATVNNGKDGKDGSSGKDGVSATHSWNNTILTVTSASGTSSANLKGDAGYSPSVKATRNDSGVTIEITEEGGSHSVNVRDGKDGVSATHSWNGTTLTVASASGTSSADLKGEPGKDGSAGSPGADGVSPTVAVSKSGKVTTISITDKSGTKTATINDGADGSPGSAGKDGTSVTVKSVSESTADGGSNVITFSDGKTVTIKNGSKGSTGGKGDTGATGQRGTGLLAVTTGPSSYTTAVGGITPKYRMAISTIKTQAGVTEVLLGDTVRYSYYHYPIAYLDASYAYMTTRVSIRGASGAAGKDYSFDPTVYRLPILNLTGSTEGMTKETEVTLSYECKDKDGTSKTGSCTMKWQGSSSLAWDKKNYTIKFDNAFEVVNGWGSQKKYCLKANWIDHSHSRNVVSAKLWGLIRKNRSNLNSKLKNLPNAGAIDGFPVIIMLNGEFHGLYSWNIPKDAWMFGMGSGTKEAIVGADNQAEDTAFKAETLLDADGWELEYNSSSFSADAVKTSLNNLIRACINSWGGDLDTEVAKYLDWESAIDYYIFAVILQGGDMITKNTILATFDGVKWYFSAYDMDTTYGLEFDGSGLVRAVTTSHTTFETIAETHRVFELIKRFKTNELKARYNALRTNELSESRICNYFENYAWDISSPILVEEVKEWSSVRGSSVNGIDQICRWVRQRLEVADAWANALPAQETPVEPEAPVVMVNQVPISTDTDGSIYNGTGYKDDVRLSSSGGVSGTAQNGSVTTGFIPFTPGSIIRIKGAEFLNLWDKYGGHYYINFYDANKNFNVSVGEGGVASNTGSCFEANYDEESGITTIKLLKGVTSDYGTKIDASSFFRINAYGKGADLIVTVNQEITA